MKPPVYIGILFTLLIVCLSIGLDIGYTHVFDASSGAVQSASAHTGSAHSKG